MTEGTLQGHLVSAPGTLDIYPYLITLLYFLLYLQTRTIIQPGKWPVNYPIANNGLISTPEYP
jgi:hypothetical protein